jgi:hypothetical protein
MTYDGQDGPPLGETDAPRNVSGAIRSWIADTKGTVDPMVQPPDYYTLMAIQERSTGIEHERRHAASLVREPLGMRVRSLLARLASPWRDGHGTPRADDQRMRQETGDPATSPC